MLDGCLGYLIGLADRMGKAEQASVAREALAAANAIDHLAQRLQALAGAIGMLPHRQRATVVQEVTTAVRALDDQGSRANVLSGLLRWVAADEQAGLLREALAACTDSPYPAWELTQLAERVPDRLGQVLAAARTIDNPYDRASALTSLAARMAESERVGYFTRPWALPAPSTTQEPG
jgi:hypothetical protein